MSKLQFRVSEDKVTIDIYGVIGESMFEEGNTAKELANKLSEIAPEIPIHVNISSPGGFVDEGLAMYDLLASRTDVTTNVSGLTGSMATIIAQSASKGKRKMSKNGMYLVHRIQTIEMGTPTDLRAEADNAEAVEGRLVDIYAQKTGRRQATIRRLMAANKERGEWWDAETAQDLGFVDEIVPDSKRAALVSHEDLKRLNLVPTPEMEEMGLIEKTQDMNIVETIKEGFNDLKTFLTGKSDESQKNEVTEKLTAFEGKLDELSKVNTDLEAQIVTLKAEKEAAALASAEELEKAKATATKEDKASDQGPDGKKVAASPFDAIREKIVNQVKYS